MALVKCKECGAQISSTASSCPQCGKKPVKAGCGVLVLIIILLFLVVWGVGTFNSSTSTTSSQPSSLANNVETPKQDYTAYIVKYMQTGLLVRVNPQLNEAYVNPLMWSQLDVDKKEVVAQQLAFYCGSKKGTNLNWVEVKHSKTGKVLAKYSQSWGFKVLE